MPSRFAKRWSRHYRPPAKKDPNEVINDRERGPHLKDMAQGMMSVIRPEEKPTPAAEEKSK